MSKEKLSSSLITSGIISIGFSLFMNTTVETTFGPVHNLGLISKQSNLLILGFFLVLIGVILKVSKENQSLDEVDASAPGEVDASAPGEVDASASGEVDASAPVIQDMALPKQSLIDWKQNNKALRLLIALLLAIFLLFALFGIMLLFRLFSASGSTGAIIFIVGGTFSILAPIAYVFKRDRKISDLMSLAKKIFKFILFAALILMAIFFIIAILFWAFA